MNGLVLAGQTLVYVARTGWTGLMSGLPVMGIAAGVLAAEWFVLSRLHSLFPGIVATAFAPFLAAAISSVFIFLYFLLIGAGVVAVWSRTGLQGLERRPSVRRYAWSWGAIAGLFSLALFALDAAQIQLQFRGELPLEPAVGIALMLAVSYGQILLLGFAVCFFAACPLRLNPEHDNRTPLWQFSRNNRLAISAGGLIVYLIVEKVLLPVLLYLPFVAPFWTMTGELSETRHYAVRAVTIIAQCLSVLIYAAFVLTAYEWGRRSAIDPDRPRPNL